MNKVNRYFNWKSFVFTTLIIVFIGIIIYSVYLYQSIETSKTDGFKNIEKLIFNSTEIKEIDDIYYYRGE